MKIILSSISVLLFTFGAAICSYFYDPCVEINQWWDLRMNLYSVLFLVLFLTSNTEAKNRDLLHLKFILGIGIGLSVSDVIDRLWLNINTFTKEDIFMIVLTIVLSFLEAYTKYNFNLFKSYASTHKSRTK